MEIETVFLAHTSDKFLSENCVEDLFISEKLIYLNGKGFEVHRTQCLQNKVLRNIGKFLRRTQVHELHKAFQAPYVYNYIMKVYRQQTEVI
jgi:hypothetical protein